MNQYNITANCQYNQYTTTTTGDTNSIKQECATANPDNEYSSPWTTITTITYPYTTYTPAPSTYEYNPPNYWTSPNLTSPPTWIYNPPPTWIYNPIDLPTDLSTIFKNPLETEEEILYEYLIRVKEIKEERFKEEITRKMSNAILSLEP